MIFASYDLVKESHTTVVCMYMNVKKQGVMMGAFALQVIQSFLWVILSQNLHINLREMQFVHQVYREYLFCMAGNRRRTQIAI